MVPKTPTDIPAPRNLAIAGYGGLGKEVAFLVESLIKAGYPWALKGYVGATPECVGNQVGRYQVFADDGWLTTVNSPISVVIAVGNLSLMEALHQRFRTNPNIHFPSLVHPSVTFHWEHVTFGQGNIVLNGSAFTTDIALGNFNIINPGCTLSHDCRLGSYNLLGPGVHLAGGVVLGDRVLLGVGAHVLPCVSICSDVVIGGGAAVTKSISEPGTYVGVPARRIQCPNAVTPSQLP